MNASKVPILIVTCTVALSLVAQTSQPLRTRIPKADPNKYKAIQDGQEWQNPKMFVRPEGIEVIGVTPRARDIPVESVPEILEHLPDSAWPYGLVVAVGDIGLIGSRKDKPRIQANRIKLLRILRQRGIVVELWPSS